MANGKRPKTEKLPVVRKRRWWRIALVIALACPVLAFVSAVGVYLYYANDPELPKIDHIADYRPKVVTKIYSADGELIGEIFDERRTVVPRNKIPDVMIHAIVDAE